MKGYWNGEPADIRRVRVIVAKPEVPTWWFADLVGQERVAVEVVYGNQTFYLDDEDGSGWDKVTRGQGSPGLGHRSLRITRVVGPEREVK